MHKKPQKEFFVSEINAPKLITLKLSLYRRGYFSPAANALTKQS